MFPWPSAFRFPPLLKGLDLDRLSDQLIWACRRNRQRQKPPSRIRNPGAERQYLSTAGNRPCRRVHRPQSTVESRTLVPRLWTRDWPLWTISHPISHSAKMAPFKPSGWHRPPACPHPASRQMKYLKQTVTVRKDRPARRRRQQARRLFHPDSSSTMPATGCGSITATASNSSTPLPPSIPKADSTPSLPTRLTSCLPGRSI